MTGVLERAPVAVSTRMPWWRRLWVAWTFVAVLALAALAPALDGVGSGPVKLAPWSGPTQVAVVDGLRVRTASWDLRRVPLARQPWLTEPVATGAASLPDGTVVFALDGHDYFHPGGTAQAGLNALASWLDVVDPGVLATAKLHADALMAHATATGNGGVVFAYPFDYPLYGDAAQTIRAPWPSAFAQGLALQLFTGLARATGDATYLRDADRAYLGLVDPATDLVQTEHGWLWLEEYPHDGTGERVFNGHNFATLGIYDYWLASGRGQSVLDAAIATSAHYASAIRKPGAVSVYSLRYGNQNAAYQTIHVAQMIDLRVITGDPWFGRMAKALRSDHQLP